LNSHLFSLQPFDGYSYLLKKNKNQACSVRGKRVIFSAARFTGSASLNTPALPADAVTYYSATAEEFHASYQNDANRLERLRVWQGFLDRYAGNAAFAYDAGCGSGILACELARRGIATIGIDGAAPMLHIASQNARAQNLTNLRFEQHQLLPADTASFEKADLVIASSLIEYLPSLPEALSFLGTLLKDNGILIFSISNRDSISRRLVQAIHGITGLPRYLALIRHFVTPETMAAQLRAAGFTCLEHAYFGKADRINKLLALFLPARFSSNMIILAARKDG
jgi:2-polyprenyl-3-methyl-5-hydroxy-6-metoxy-1,4-benzoquinol methylase